MSDDDDDALGLVRSLARTVARLGAALEDEPDAWETRCRLEALEEKVARLERYLTQAGD